MHEQYGRDVYLLKGVLLQQRLQGCIQRLAHVLQKDRLSKLHGIFEGAEVVAICKLDDDEALCLLHGPDELVGSALQAGEGE